MGIFKSRTTEVENVVEEGVLPQIDLEKPVDSVTLQGPRGLIGPAGPQGQPGPEGPEVLQARKVSQGNQELLLST